MLNLTKIIINNISQYFPNHKINININTKDKLVFKDNFRYKEAFKIKNSNNNLDRMLKV